MEIVKLTPKEKALKINLDPTFYGSFAEIGAGQETAAMFFKSGGASGTIAKTMSAYDMAFSNAIYGPEESGRYVCLPRVIKMLNKEYELLPERLSHRISNTCFFVFANTVEALNYRRTNEGHGWLGVKFQLRPQSEPNECIIHVRLLDNDPIQQQNTLGIVGVNLIYGCLYMHHNPEALMNSIVDEVTNRRVELDFFKLKGPDFKHIDHRLFSLKLVKNNLSNATMFGPDGDVFLPADALYKKNILVLRGRFRPPTHVNIDMYENGFLQFIKDEDVPPSQTIRLVELTLQNLQVDDTTIDERDFLSRVDILCSLGCTVMISNYPEYYKLISYLSKFTRGRKIGIIVGIYNLLSIFEEKHYEHLRGGILEAFGLLFGNNVKTLVYPSFNRENQHLMRSHDIELPQHLKHLFDFLLETRKLEDIEGVNINNLNIISDNVLAMIKRAEPGWEQFVPDIVAQAIKKNCLFDYPCETNPNT